MKLISYLETHGTGVERFKDAEVVTNEQLMVVPSIDN
ncbi:hypothetical protein WS105_0538 [Weissella ceti]|uniref:Uncharacterized protein n=2 Tax=Weissella TaxID=46255 RepID=A0A075TVA6_9LACO|nr:hypothetical protein WS08_0540 [Weissella tructae]AIM62793.1 hypothetical protein WS74_0541 [Weissella ceti]AIM64128.1 hypothetical protein WS105_0538 [Weissella ceti]